MIPEIGNFLLALSLAFSVLLSLYPLWGAMRGEQKLIMLARPLTHGVSVCVSMAFLCLGYAFITNDFSVAYVANNSNTQLPLYYRIGAIWGGHEGSLLLWVYLLSFWTSAVALFSQKMPQDAVARVLSVMGMISTGFLLFTLFTSNPFTRTLPDFPIDGRDLNPLLQDVGLILHPPLLYMGYVGFSVAFAFAIASLMVGRLDTVWARWSRPWTLAAWVFLTLGIVMGSAWAYYELGWGGWWFWDPVENASLMPWLVGTALFHSLAVTEKRGTFKAWTVLLAIVAFSLCLVGTFLVRSGVLVSVHAFSSDPARGLFILAFLIVVIGGALLLYALQGGRVRSYVQYGTFSRETFLLGNNVLLIAMMLVVLLGTLLPLIHKQLGLGSISVGEPFFNTMFTWLMVPFSLILGIGPLVRWRRDKPAKFGKRLLWVLLSTSVLSVALLWLNQYPIKMLALLGVFLALWISLLTLMELYERARPHPQFFSGLTRLSRSHWGMVMGHLGVAAIIVGVTFSQHYSIERDVRMNPGDSVTIADYQFILREMRKTQGPNYQSDVGLIDVMRHNNKVTVLRAEKRYYSTVGSVMTEAAIEGGLTRDLYAALGEALGDGSWAVRLYYKPFVRWIWYGGALMALGALFCLLDRRYRTVSNGASRGANES